MVSGCDLETVVHSEEQHDAEPLFGSATDAMASCTDRPVGPAFEHVAGQHYYAVRADRGIVPAPVRIPKFETGRRLRNERDALEIRMGRDADSCRVISR